MSLGSDLKNARLKAGLTQKELANQAGLSEITIRQYEADKRQPRLETLKHISNILKVTDFLNKKFYIQADYSVEYKEIKDWISKYLQGQTEENRWSLELTLLENYRKLNNEGQDKAREQVEMLTKIPEYQRTESDQEDGNADEQPDK